MSTFTTEAFDKAAAAWSETTVASIWTPAGTELNETTADSPAVPTITTTLPALQAKLTTAAQETQSDVARLDEQLTNIFAQMFSALQPVQALQEAVNAVRAFTVGNDVGMSLRIKEEYQSQSYDPLAGLKALGLNPTAPQRTFTLRRDAAALSDANRTKALRERSLILKTKLVALTTEIVNLTRELVQAEVEARIRLMTTGNKTLNEARLQAEFGASMVDSQVKQVQYQMHKLEESSARKEEALLKAQATYERIALKTGLSAQVVQSVITSASQAAAGAVNSVRLGYADSSTDQITFEVP